MNLFIILYFKKKFLEKEFKEKIVSIKEYHYIFSFSYNNVEYIITFYCLGNYNDLHNKYNDFYFGDMGKPDILVLENSKIILAIEDTDTSQIGNSSLQRMERIDYFLKNKIKFLYITFFKSSDRSGTKKQKREPSKTQLIFFENIENIEILYKYDQDEYRDNDGLLIGNYFIKNFLKIENNYDFNENFKKEIRKSKNYNFLVNSINAYNNNLNNSRKNMLSTWNSDSLKHSDFYNNLRNKNQLFTFSQKAKQKVGFAKFLHVLTALKELKINTNLYKTNYDLDSWVLINPVMFFQKSGNEIKVKVDPATGEFFFYKKLFDNLINLTLVYSEKASKELITKYSNKLVKHLKEYSDILLISNGKENKIINNNELKNDRNKNIKNNKKNKLNEDDLDFAFYNFVKKNGFFPLYISSPASSWSRILYKGKKIFDISKNDNRIDFAFINEENKTIIIGESKIKIKDLKNNRVKHKENFENFKKKLKEIENFQKYNFHEINLSYFSDDVNEKKSIFNLIEIKVNEKNLSYEIVLDSFELCYLFINKK